MKIHIPSHVKEIIQRLLDHEYPTYLVGGSVRDNLLNVETDDYDLATTAFPHEVKDIFSDCNFFDYGERHGTIGLSVKNSKVEITTFREENGYSDGRRPDKVTFVRNLTSDVNRRDFTINALAADIDGNIIDLVNGIQDFKRSIIRAVGDPNKRFEEDSLRVLRAIRFAARLGFVIEDNTRDAIMNKQNLLITHAVSGERIFTELNGILKFPKTGFSMINDYGILQSLFPSIDHKQHEKNILGHIEKLAQTNDPLTVWTLIFVEWFSSFHPKTGSAEISKIFQEYPGMNKKNQNLIKFLVEYGVIDQYFLESEKEDILKYWFVPLVIVLDQNMPYHLYFDYVTRINSAIHHNQFTISSSRFLSIQNKIINGQRISGEDIISLGYTGKSVGILMKLVPLIQIFKTQNQDISQILAVFSHLQGKEFGDFMSFLSQGLLDENLPKKYHLHLRDLIYDLHFLCNNKALKLVISVSKLDLDILLKNLIEVDTVVHSNEFDPNSFYEELSNSFDSSKINLVQIDNEEKYFKGLHNAQLDLVSI